MYVCACACVCVCVCVCACVHACMCVCEWLLLASIHQVNQEVELDHMLEGRDSIGRDVSTSSSSLPERRMIGCNVKLAALGEVYDIKYIK